MKEAIHWIHYSARCWEHPQAIAWEQQWTHPSSSSSKDFYYVQYYLAREYFNHLSADTEKHRQGIALLQSSSQSGLCPDATYRLAYRHLEGLKVSHDVDKALELINSISPEMLTKIESPIDATCEKSLKDQIMETKRTWDMFRKDTKTEVDAKNASRYQEVDDLLKTSIPSRDVRAYLLDYVWAYPTPRQIKRFHPPAPHVCPHCCSGWLNIDKHSGTFRSSYKTSTSSCDTCNFRQQHEMYPYMEADW